MAQGRIPVTFGSNVPPCPTFSIPITFFNRRNLVGGGTTRFVEENDAIFE